LSEVLKSNGHNPLAPARTSVRLEERQKRAASNTFRQLRGKQLPAEPPLLRSTAVGKIQEDWCQTFQVAQWILGGKFPLRANRGNITQ